MKTNSVKFKDLSQYNDSNSCVLIATTFPADFKWQELDDFLQNELGFSKGKNLIGVHHICDNIKGEDGRTDWLLEFDNESTPFNPIKRLLFTDLKWTSDFIDNFKDDYSEMCCVCGEPIKGYGHNAFPLREGLCCDRCNLSVIAKRMELWKQGK